MASEKIIKVSGHTSAKQLAGCVFNCIENNESVEVRAVGAGAVNQMYKSLAIVRGKVACSGSNLLICPGFMDIEEDGKTKTAMIARVVIQ